MQKLQISHPRPLSPFVVVLLTFLPAVLCAESAPKCSDLAELSTPTWRVTQAEVGANPAHCRVSGVIETEIRFELLLPDDWNGSFTMGGGGGFVGSVQNQAQTPLSAGGSALSRGYATVGTDTGHSGSGIDGSWALDNEERVQNFGYRAVHLTAETAKELIHRFYGKKPRRSYFIGCSRGGGQGMMESQRYPQDFDGIVSGAPAYDWPGLGAGFVQTQKAIYPRASDLTTPVITAENRALLERSIEAACDKLDGVEDGILTDPRRCDFDPADVPRCAGNQPGAECLTEAQLAAIQVVYRGAVVGDRQLYPGFPFGGETDVAGWGRWIVGGGNGLGAGVPSLHHAFGTQMYKYLVFNDPQWDYTRYDFSSWKKDTARSASILNATSTDLRAFKANGGKLLFFQGWSDPAITALGTIQYYEELVKHDPEAAQYSRLFLMPGVLHCAGGPGPDRVDWLETIAAWVERGQAPERIIASKPVSGLSRPLCPYPEVAHYKGEGDPNQEQSFECRLP